MAQTAGWVSEFDQYTPVGPVDLTGGVVGPEHDVASLQSLGSKGRPSAAEGGNTSTVEELQAEMKLLNWHKLANEAALKVRSCFPSKRLIISVFVLLFCVCVLALFFYFQVASCDSHHHLSRVATYIFCCCLLLPVGLSFFPSLFARRRSFGRRSCGARKRPCRSKRCRTKLLGCSR